MKAAFVTGSVGLAYQLIGRKDGGFSLPIFFGPTVNHARFSQTIIDYPNSNPGSPSIDFDMQASHTLPGLMAGAQAGINLGKYFGITPFIINTWSFGDVCQPYEVTQNRSSRDGLAGQPTPNCSESTTGVEPTNRPLVDYPQGALTAGAALTYKPWGLSANITAPFLRKSLAKDEGVSVVLFSITYSFGNYIRGVKSEDADKRPAHDTLMKE